MPVLILTQAFKSINREILRLEISLLSLSLEKSQKAKRPDCHKINYVNNMDILPLALSEYWLLNMFDVRQLIFYVKCWKKH